MGGAVVVGVDVGGTKIMAGVSTAGGLSAVKEVPTHPGDGPRNLAAVRSLLDSQPYSAASKVGISVPTSVDPSGGLRADDGFVGWGGYQLGRLLSRPSRTVKAFPDVECGALAEALLGAGRNIHHVLYVTIGTGLSHCLVLEGTPYAGSTVSAYYCGYTVPTRCDRSACTARTAEEICAGPGLARAYDGSCISRDSRTVVELAARSDDARAAEVISHAALHLGHLFADLIHILNPGIVVVGGGVGVGAPSYIDQAIAVARRSIRPSEESCTPIVRAAFGNQSCCVGAAMRAQGPH